MRYYEGIALVFSLFVFLRFTEVVNVTDEAPQGEGSMEPNLFKQIDTNGDGKLDKDEIDTYFKGFGQPTPDGLWESEDKDKDGYISWDEFSGPKEDPKGEEL